MSYTICSRFKGEHIVYAGYTICTSREHIVYGAFCGSTVQHFLIIEMCITTSRVYNAVSKFEHVFVCIFFFLLLNKSQDISAFHLRMLDHVMYHVSTSSLRVPTFDYTRLSK